MHNFKPCDGPAGRGGLEAQQVTLRSPPTGGLAPSPNPPPSGARAISLGGTPSHTPPPYWREGRPSVRTCSRSPGV